MSQSWDCTDISSSGCYIIMNQWSTGFYFLLFFVFQTLLIYVEFPKAIFDTFVFFAFLYNFSRSFCLFLFCFLCFYFCIFCTLTFFQHFFLFPLFCIFEKTLKGLCKNIERTLKELRVF